MAGELLRSLMTAPLRPSFLLAAIGDSRMRAGYTVSGSDVYRNAHGPSNWVGILTGGKVASPYTYNRAVNGSTLVGYDGDGVTGTGGAGAKGIIPANGSAGQLDEVLALNPRPTHCLILTGTNAIAYGDQTVAQMQATFVQIWTALLNVGIIPVTMLDLPRGWTTAALRRRHFALNRWLLVNSPAYGSVVIDSTAKLMDIASATGDPLAAYYYDSPAVHPGSVGAYQAALPVAAYFNALAASSAFHGFSAGDVYDATDNPGGNLMPNGGVGYGTAGTKTGTNVTGTVWSGMQVALISGSVTACACSIAARADGGAGNWQIIDLTTAGAASIWFYPVSDISFAAGDIAEFGADIDASGLGSGVSNIAARLLDYNGASQLAAYYALSFDHTAPDKGALPTAFAGRVVTDPMTMLANTTRAVPVVSLTTTGAVTNAILKVGALSLRRK